MRKSIIDFLKENIENFSTQEYKIKINELENNSFELYYHTSWHSDWSEKLQMVYPIFDYLNNPFVAPCLKKLVITSADEGVNGTQNWDIDYFIQHKNLFPNLIEIAFPINKKTSHNRTIITYQSSYDENKSIGLLLQNCPALQKLTVPSAPSSNFATTPSPNLKELIVYTGYAHQDFIKNISKSKCFPNMEYLCFGDYNETYMDNYQDACTPYAHYVALLKNKHLTKLKKIRLKNTVLSSPQKKELKAIATANGIELTITN